MYQTQQAQQENVVVVHIEFPYSHDAHISFHDDDDLEEFLTLARSSGANVIDVVTGKAEKPRVKYFMGQGKAEEVRDVVAFTKADVVLVNHELSPTQERNLEKLIKCRVVNRTGLILDIFSKRARTHEGKLQVELAQLEHLSTRLVRGWTHLERQRGGIGLRGPGETQLETDRRLLRNRVKHLKQRIEKVRKQRVLSRQARRKGSVPTIAFVGYTNAGKSTLFNALTKADVYVADQLFATLDPTLRRWYIPDLGNVVLADTVGFISRLPHQLIDAFRATLEEVVMADCLFHVVDAADPLRRQRKKNVEQVLDEIGAAHVKRIDIYNKVDLLADENPHIERREDGSIKRIWLSAIERQGFDLLPEALREVTLTS